ncbi:MAG: hypothetical protein RR232_04475 [Clostridia bacterium]
MQPERALKRGLPKSVEPVIFIAVFGLVGTLFSVPMGLSNMLNTLMNTAYGLLMDTALYIMAIAVITGSLSSLFAEFGVIELLNKLLSPLMKPLYRLPGAAALGVVTTYLSDNPAILTLADDPKFRRYFKQYQLPALTNLGTAFGMGLIVSTFMLGLAKTAGQSLGSAVLIGNIGAIIGSIVSTRLMICFTRRLVGADLPARIEDGGIQQDTPANHDPLGIRFINSMLDGGKRGVKLGFSIIPGVLIICTLVLMLTNGPSTDGTYTGAANEGIALLPFLANKIDFLLKPLFGFQSAKSIAVPITALGSAGAAIGLVPQLLKSGFANVHDISVFTAMCMCWSGYLSTHVSMMDSLGCSELTGKAVLSHTIGGLCAGIAANWIYLGVQAIFL